MDETREQTTSAGSAQPMHRWERALALTFGVGVATAGAVSTFTDTNQAGSAALVVVGAALVLVGVQGTRLVKLGGSSASAEFERRMAEQKVIEAITSEPDPDVAKGIAEGVVLVDPALAPAASMALGYETMALAALRSLDVVTDIEQQGRGDARSDIVAQTTGGPILIELKLGTGSLSADSLRQLAAHVQSSRAAAGGLLLTNMPLTDDAKALNEHLSAASPPVEALTWTGPWDNDRLTRAILRLRRGRPSDNGPTLAQ